MENDASPKEHTVWVLFRKVSEPLTRALELTLMNDLKVAFVGFVLGAAPVHEKKRQMVIRACFDKGFGFLGLGSAEAVAKALACPDIKVTSDVLGKVKAKESTRPVANN